MARESRKADMKQVALSVVKDDLSRYLREAGRRDSYHSTWQACRNLDRLCFRR